MNQDKSTTAAIKKRVVTGMSGGVDSSAAALILYRQGFEVIGVTLKLWDYGEEAGSGKCCTPEDVRDARRVAFGIDIPYYVRDYSEKFKRDVVDYFTASYLEGRTPNPCAMCNDKIKFNLLDLLADEVQAGYIGTGHYAKVAFNPTTQEYELSRGADESRDQSYFLFRLQQDRLQRLLFPLGELRKTEVRDLLRETRVGCADKAESREICFVANDKYAEFVEAAAKEKVRSGTIVDQQGKQLATHQGVHQFTVGQRKGLGIGAAEPLYVTAIDGTTRQVKVGSKEQAYKTFCRVEQVTWTGPSARKREVQAQLRYRGVPIEAQLDFVDDTTVDVRFKGTTALPTPGQAAVFYDGDRLLGGGWIA